jgi:6-phosphofructokinase 1
LNELAAGFPDSRWGWRAAAILLGGGLAGGADVILIPELPYDMNVVVEHLLERRRMGKRFSIIVVAEGVCTPAELEVEARGAKKARTRLSKRRERDRAAPEPRSDEERAENRSAERELAFVQEPTASRLARHIQELVGIEARVTSLGHVQRGGPPTSTDRLLCTRLGTRAAQLLAEGRYNVMVAVRGEGCEPVPLEEVAGIRKTVPLDHPWLTVARLVGTCLGQV